MQTRTSTPRRGRALAAPALLLGPLLAACPAHAGKIKQTAAIFETVDKSPAGTTSNYLRVTIAGLPKDAVINDSSSAYVMTPAGRVFSIPVARVQPAQPGQGAKNDGFVDFEKAGFVFNPGDEVVVKVATNGDTAGKLKPTSGLFRTGVQNAANTTDSFFKVSGLSVKFDPDLTLFNALDPTVYPDTSLAIRNLRFGTDLSQAAFDSLSSPASLLALAAASPDSSLPSASLPSGGMDDLGPVVGQPAIGNWDAVSGQIYDTSTGLTLTAFVQGAQAGVVPEAGSPALLTLGLLPLGLAVRKNRKKTARV